MLCLSGFELYSRWVPMNTSYRLNETAKEQTKHQCSEIHLLPWSKMYVFTDILLTLV